MNATRSDVTPSLPTTRGAHNPANSGHTLVLGDDPIDLCLFLKLTAGSSDHCGSHLLVTSRQPTSDVDELPLVCEASRDGGRTFEPCTYNPVADGSAYQIAGRIVSALCQPGDFETTLASADDSVGGALSHRVRDVPIEVAGALRAVGADTLAKRWILTTHTWPKSALCCSTPSVSMDEVVRGEAALRIMLPDLRGRPCVIDGKIQAPDGTWAMIQRVFASLVISDYAQTIARVRIRDASVKAVPKGTIALFGPSITDGAHLAPLLRVLEQGRAVHQRLVLAARSLSDLGDGDANVAQAIDANTATKVLFHRDGPEGDRTTPLGKGDYIVVHDGQQPDAGPLPTGEKLRQVAGLDAGKLAADAAA